MMATTNNTEQAFEGESERHELQMVRYGRPLVKDIHKGKYIATVAGGSVDKPVLGYSTDPKEAHDAAVKTGCKDPMISYVPGDAIEAQLKYMMTAPHI